MDTKADDNHCAWAAVRWEQPQLRSSQSCLFNLEKGSRKPAGPSLLALAGCSEKGSWASRGKSSTEGIQCSLALSWSIWVKGNGNFWLG